MTLFVAAVPTFGLTVTPLVPQHVLKSSRELARAASAAISDFAAKEALAQSASVVDAAFVGVGVAVGLAAVALIFGGALALLGALALSGVLVLVVAEDEDATALLIPAAQQSQRGLGHPHESLTQTY